MSQSLGFRPGCDRVAQERPPPKPRPPPAVLPPPATQPNRCGGMLSRAMSMCMVPKGYLATLLMAGCFLAVPLLHEYTTPDYTDTATRGGVIGASAALSLLIIGANDCGAWFNFVLFFHTGVEVTVLDTLQTYAQAATTTTENEVWAWIGFGVILAHLLPFYLMDYNAVLIPLAAVGVSVNTAVLVFLDSTQFMYVGLSAAALLGTTLYVCGQCEKRCCMMTLMRDGMKEGSLLSCKPCIM